MSKWIGPGVLKVKKGKDVLLVKPKEDFDKNLLDEARFNSLLEQGFIDGVKSRKTAPAKDDSKKDDSKKDDSKKDDGGK